MGKGGVGARGGERDEGGQRAHLSFPPDLEASTCPEQVGRRGGDLEGEAPDILDESMPERLRRGASTTSSMVCGGVGERGGGGGRWGGGEGAEQQLRGAV